MLVSLQSKAVAEISEVLTLNSAQLGRVLKTANGCQGAGEIGWPFAALHFSPSRDHNQLLPYLAQPGEVRASMYEEKEVAERGKIAKRVISRESGHASSYTSSWRARI